MSEGKISSDHIKELKKFMAFFESKRSESFKEIDLDFKDFLYDNLTETIFNKEDVIISLTFPSILLKAE